jgi:aconitase A
LAMTSSLNFPLPSGRLFEGLPKQSTILTFTPFSLRILLEAVLRQVDGIDVREEDVLSLCRWEAADSKAREIPFKPARW